MRRAMIRLFASAVILATTSTTAIAVAQDRTVPRPAGEVTIHRDKMGVPHVFADTGPEVFFGGSYAIAEDRLAQAELESRVILGRMAELQGESAVESDKMARLALPTDADMKAQYERLDPEYQALFTAMHDGWIARVREVKADPKLLPYEFKEWGISPTEWSKWDFLKVMGSVAKYYGTNGGGRELTNLAFYREMVAKYGEDKAKRIFDDVVPLDDASAVPILPGKEVGLVPSVSSKLVDMQRMLPLGKLQASATRKAHQGARRIKARAGSS